MDPIVTSSLISAGANFLGGLFGGSSAKKAAKAQMAWQERMDNTKYQRGVADAQAAGLNKMVVIDGMKGSTPSGAMDVSGQIQAQAASNAVNSALTAAMNKAQIEQMDLQNDKILADTSASNTAADLNRSLAAQANANTVNTTLNSEGLRNKNVIEGVKGDVLTKVKPTVDKGVDMIDNILNMFSPNSAADVARKPPPLPKFKLRSDAERLAPYMKR